MTVKTPSTRKCRIAPQEKWKQTRMIHWHPLQPLVIPKLKKTGHVEVSGEDLVAIATRKQNKVHRVPDRHESVKDRTLRTRVPAEVTKGHRRETRDRRKDWKSEADGVGKHRSDLMRAVNLPDVENEGGGALVNGLARRIWIVLIQAFPQKHQTATKPKRIHVHADAGVEDPKIPVIQPEQGIAIEMRAEDALNVPRDTKMKTVMNLAPKYNQPAKIEKMTRKAHAHDRAVEAAEGVAGDGIVMRAETENRLPSRVTIMILF